MDHEIGRNASVAKGAEQARTIGLDQGMAGDVQPQEHVALPGFDGLVGQGGVRAAQQPQGIAAHGPVMPVSAHVAERHGFDAVVGGRVVEQGQQQGAHDPFDAGFEIVAARGRDVDIESLLGLWPGERARDASGQLRHLRIRGPDGRLVGQGTEKMAQRQGCRLPKMFDRPCVLFGANRRQMFRLDDLFGPLAQDLPFLRIAPQGLYRLLQGCVLELVRQDPERLGIEFGHGAVGIDDQRQAMVHAVQDGARGFAAGIAAQLHGQVGGAQILLIRLRRHIAGNGDALLQPMGLDLPQKRGPVVAAMVFPTKTR